MTAAGPVERRVTDAEQGRLDPAWLGRGWWLAIIAVVLAAVVTVVAPLGWERPEEVPAGLELPGVRPRSEAPRLLVGRAPSYSHRTQYISELGARHAPNGALVSIGFLVIGLLLLAFTAWIAARTKVAGTLLVGVLLVGGAVGTSYAVSGVARCDPGCPDVGPTSTAQLVHNVTGTVGYSVAILGVAVFGWAGRRDGRWGGLARASLVLAPVLLVVALATPLADEWRGLLQRIVEVGQMGWLLAVAIMSRSSAEAGPAPAR